MKKFVLVLFAVCLTCVTAMAQESEEITQESKETAQESKESKDSNEPAEYKGKKKVGLYLGAEFIVPDFVDIADKIAEEIKSDDADDIVFLLIRPYLGFERSFGNFDVYAELGVDVPIGASGPGVDFTLGAAYNLAFTETSVLALGLGTWTYLPFGSSKGMYTEVSPYGTSMAGSVFDGLIYKFSHHLNMNAVFTKSFEAIDLYVGMDMPFNVIGPKYFENNEWENIKPFEIAELNFTAGFDTEMGIGIGLTLYNWIGKGGDFLQNLDLAFTYFTKYVNDTIFVGLTFGFPVWKYEENGIEIKGMDEEGFSVALEFEYGIDSRFAIYTEIPVWGISTGTMGVGFTIGAKVLF